ncbi:MAG: hypothetical protein N3E47_05850 [Candidatus Bathyarchaeota archaeon]|nr:hypothetical protein [Candidatus Bathyarchaeota archaeon]
MGDSFEEALSNIDVFCSVLVRKMIEDKEPQIKPEPIENILRKKFIVRDGGFEWKEPLIDVFEDEKQMRILMQFSSGGEKVELHPREDCMEIWVGKNQRIKLTIDPDTDKTTVKWANRVLEITVQK